MAFITPDIGQSESAVNAQSTTYFVQKAILECPGAPDTLVQSKLQDVVNSFYRDSLAWREVVGPYKIVANRNEITLNPVDQYTSVQYVLGAYLLPDSNGGNRPQYLKASPTLLVGTDVGPPAAFFMMKPDLMQLFPSPNATLGAVLYVYAALRPEVNTPRLPDLATTHHFDALMAGLLARLYAMPRKPWTDKDLARDKTNEYKRYLLRFQDEARRGYSLAAAPFRFPRFANNGSQGGVYAAR